jgi:hypothetical protein
VYVKQYFPNEITRLPLCPRGDACMLGSANAGFCRVFASLSGLCLGYPWLAHPNSCTCVACRNVCPALGKDFNAVAELGGDNMDDWVGRCLAIFLRLMECGNTTALRLRAQICQILNSRVALPAFNHGCYQHLLPALANFLFALGGNAIDATKCRIVLAVLAHRPTLLTAGF